MMIPQRGGLPHSDIHGSKPARGSPWLFAACHVLHRLLVPRHPPNALIALHTRSARPRTNRSATMHRNHRRHGTQSSKLHSSVLRKDQTTKTTRCVRQNACARQSYQLSTYSNASEHCRIVRLDDPWPRQPRSLPVRQTTRQHDGPTLPRSKPAPPRQPNHNRAVLRAQKRTRTRFTTQKNNAARPQPGSKHGMTSPPHALGGEHRHADRGTIP